MLIKSMLIKKNKCIHCNKNKRAIWMGSPWTPWLLRKRKLKPREQVEFRDFSAFSFSFSLFLSLSLNNKRIKEVIIKANE